LEQRINEIEEISGLEKDQSTRGARRLKGQKCLEDWKKTLEGWKVQKIIGGSDGVMHGCNDHRKKGFEKHAELDGLFTGMLRGRLGS
jgi:hypothetical protein